jgi:ribose transport system substrate-binding protein
MSLDRVPRRTGRAAVAGVALALLAAACGSGSSGGGTSSTAGGSASWTKYHVDYAHASEAGSIEVTIRKGIQDAARRLGIPFNLYENAGDGPTALTNARLMIQDRPDLIIEYNLVDGVGPSLGTLLTNSKIPCMSVNVRTPGCPWINLSNKISGVGAGEIVAREAAKKGWTAQDTTVLILQCSTCGFEINNSPRWFYLTVAQKLGMPTYPPEQISAQTTTLGPNLYQVDDADLSIDKAYNNVKTALQSIPSNRHLLVFAINDDSSTGAWRAISASGRGDVTLIGGLSGLPEGLDQLRTNPQWVAEGSLFLPAWGEYVMAMGVAILQGAHPPDLTLFPQITMDKQTVEKYYPNGSNDAKLLPALPAVDQYLAKSGVLQAFNNVDGLTK